MHIIEAKVAHQAASLQDQHQVGQHQRVATIELSRANLSEFVTDVPVESGDAFDGSAEPTVYMSENRMPVVVEFNSVVIYIAFAALIFALVLILPGIRRLKMASFTSLVTILLVGASILLSLNGSHWLSGELKVLNVPYGALTSETISGILEVNIGLSSTNVSLFGRLTNAGASNSETIKQVDYNERFHWDKPDRMLGEHADALRRGLPYPILTATEFLSQDSDGFNWMRQLRQAGYFASLALYAALASWCLTTLVLCLLPVYLAHMMQITGALMMSSVCIYTLLVQAPQTFVIQFGETPMEFNFGYNYVLTFTAGALSMLAGVMMLIVQAGKPFDQPFTIMDCDEYLANQKASTAAERLPSTGLGQKQLFGQTLKLHSGLPTKKLDTQRVERAFIPNVIIPINDIEEKFAQLESQSANQSLRPT